MLKLLLTLLPMSLFGMNGMYQIGYGTVAKGMGGAEVGLAQESLALVANPAGLGALTTRLDVGVDGIHYGGDSQINNNTFHSNRTVIFPELGAVLACKKFAIGVAAYYKGGFYTDYGASLPGSGTSDLLGRYLLYSITPAATWKVCKTHYIGAAVNFTWGSARFRGLESVGIADPGTEDEVGASATVGYYGSLLDLVSFGLSYQTKTWMSTFSKYKALASDFTTAPVLQVGFAINLPTLFQYGLDVGYNFWNGLDLFGWKDQLFVKTGIAYQPDCSLILRIGYYYSQRFFEVDNVALNSATLLTPEHHLTLGLSYLWRCNRFTLAYIHGFARTVRGERNISGDQDQLSVAWGRCF